MLKRNGYVLSDEQVRNIKANMVQGVTLTALSRMYNVSTETLSRIRRGLTYKHIAVLGEDKLRPPVEMVAPTAEHQTVMSGTSDEELLAQGRALFEMQERLKVQQLAKSAVDEATKEQMRKLGYD